jgi:hypothetical protein
MLDRRMLIEADDANERCGQFKGAGKLGQENEQAIQAPFLPASAIFLPSIFLPDDNRPMTQRHLNRVRASMSAMSPIAEELRAFSMNGTDHAGGARDLTTGEDVAAASCVSDGYDLPASICRVFAATLPWVTRQRAERSQS